MADPDPTIILVHGAFADASSLRGLYDELVGENLTIIAPPNPLRGLSGGDGEYLKGVGTADRCIDPGVHRFSYERMGAQITEVEGASHVVMISHPKEVAAVVMTAVSACAALPA